jgi:hypothetical protein
LDFHSWRWGWCKLRTHSLLLPNAPKSESVVHLVTVPSLVVSEVLLAASQSAKPKKPLATKPTAKPKDVVVASVSSGLRVGNTPVVPEIVWRARNSAAAATNPANALAKTNVLAKDALASVNATVALVVVRAITLCRDWLVLVLRKPLVASLAKKLDARQERVVKVCVSAG